MATRLDSVDADLSRRLAEASPEQQRAAVAAAVDLAALYTRLAGQPSFALTSEALRAVEARRTDSALREQIDQLTKDLDEIGFDLSEQADDDPAKYPEYKAAFTRARAVAAIGYALSDDPADAAIEGVYEAFAAVGEIAEIRRVVEPTLA